ncbi:MAG: hypothetical protein U0736_08665 [Gemmataceae bacterium]
MAILEEGIRAFNGQRRLGFEKDAMKKAAGAKIVASQSKPGDGPGQ